MIQQPLNTAIVGIGRWGKHVATDLNAVSNLVAYVSQGASENKEWAARHIPSARPASLAEICADTSIRAVVIATPIKTHCDIAQQLLRAGKHVFVEKPLAQTSFDAYRLTHEASQRNLLLVTGYVFLYSPVYQELKRRIGAIDIKQVLCVWKKYGTFMESIEQNVLTHHLAFALDMCGKPDSIHVFHDPSIERARNAIETTLSYPKTTFHSAIDRLSQEKRHTLEVHLADGKTFKWDGSTLYGKESSDLPFIPLYTNDAQPLRAEIHAFVTAASTAHSALPSSGTFGARVLELHDQMCR